MTDSIADFTAKVRRRVVENYLRDSGVEGRCAECDAMTPEKDAEGEWWCGCGNWMDDDAHNDPRSAA